PCGVSSRGLLSGCAVVLLLPGGAAVVAGLAGIRPGPGLGLGIGIRAWGLLPQPLAAGALQVGQRLVEAVERVQVGAVGLRLGGLGLRELQKRGRAQPVALP